MIRDLILENVKLNNGDYLDQIYYDSIAAKKF
jgi:hypothetical protein